MLLYLLLLYWSIRVFLVGLSSKTRPTVLSFFFLRFRQRFYRPFSLSALPVVSSSRKKMLALRRSFSSARRSVSTLVIPVELVSDTL